MTRKDSRDYIARDYLIAAKNEFGVYKHPEDHYSITDLENDIPEHIEMMNERNVTMRMIYAAIREWRPMIPRHPEEELDLSWKSNGWLGLDGHTFVREWKESLVNAIIERAVELAKQNLSDSTKAKKTEPSALSSGNTKDVLSNIIDEFVKLSETYQGGGNAPLDEWDSILVKLSDLRDSL